MSGERNLSPMTLLPLGDQAILVYLADENTALGFATKLRSQPFSWVVDVVQAYTSVAVFYDVDQTTFLAAAEMIRRLEAEREPRRFQAGPLHHIPCCYEFQLDLQRVAEHVGLGADEVIRLHLETEYTVYAIGFCPGFPYLGYLPEALIGVPRLATPRLRVEAGSIGLTGRQTGIYTLPRPGGWNLVGRTPLQLVDLSDAYFPLRTGDRVRFERIDDRRFRELQGERLESVTRALPTQVR